MAEGTLQTARAVREAALATDGVFDLGKGLFVEAATYDAGDKVSGVVVDDDSVEVHLVLDYPLVKPIPELDKQLKGSLGSVSGGRTLNLVFADIIDEEEKAAARQAEAEKEATEQTNQTTNGTN